jgi:hypothetical protein
LGADISLAERFGDIGIRIRSTFLAIGKEAVAKKIKKGIMAVPNKALS